MKKGSVVKGDPPAPSHPLTNFSLKACVDWIEVIITLDDLSQWHHFKRRIENEWGNIYVEPLDSRESSRQFRVKFQDPGSADHWLGKMQRCMRPGETLREDAVSIVGVEIAIDAKHPSNDPRVLAQAALHFLRHQAHTAPGMPRITRPPYWDCAKLAERYAKSRAEHELATKIARRDGTPPPPKFKKKDGESVVVDSLPAALDALTIGHSINQGRRQNDKTGDRGDSMRARFYVKMNDTQDGVAYAPLKPKDYRARMEKTLIDDAVPFRTVAEWRDFRFETLARDFELVMPHAPTTPLSALLQSRVIQWGRNDEEIARQPRHREAVAKSREPSYRRAFRRSTHPDTVANAKIAKALSGLTGRNRVKTRKK